jgi:glutamate 5-kinase
VRRNKVSGGMVLKLEACKRALSAGVSQVRIVGGTARTRPAVGAGNDQEPGTRVMAGYPAQCRCRRNEQSEKKPQRSFGAAT